MQATKKLIEFGANHSTVLGTTRFGKTYGVIESLARIKQGVLFFNVQHSPMGGEWVEADKTDDIKIIIAALRRGEKINYLPDREIKGVELKVIITQLYKASEARLLDIYLVVDEVHLFEKAALKSCIEVATTGLRWGIKAVWISQRPQKIDNTLMSQSTYFVFYKTHNEREDYFRGYGIPYQEINSRIPGKYYYVTYDGAEVAGPFMV